MIREMYVFDLYRDVALTHELHDHRIGWDNSLSFQPYGDLWRQHRKIFHHFFHANAIAVYQPIQLMIFRKMVLDMIERPEDFMYITRRYVHQYLDRFMLIRLRSAQ